MVAPEKIDVERLVDEQKLSWLNIKILAWMLLVLLADGYDLNAVAIIAPDVTKAWHIDRTALGVAFSAGLIGVAIGSALFGYLGDKIGRKRGIVLGCALYGLFSLATVAASSVQELILLRFLTGISLGGAMPNVYVLAAEFAPKKFRAAFAVLSGIGITLGAASAGPVYAALAPHYGWPAVFYVGGIAPIAIALGVYAFVPESLKFLALQGNRRAEVTHLARLIRPDLVIGEETQFVVPPKVKTRVIPDALFRDGLAAITLLLWTVFLMQNATNFFVNMWMTTLFRESGMPAQQAALAQSTYFFGANFGVLTMALFLGRFGFAAIACMTVIYLPMIATIGALSISSDLLSTVVFIAGLCNGAIYTGLGAAAALLYPTGIRANGTGWALGIGRIGAIIGPVIGGALLARHVSPQNIFSVLLIPLGISIIAAAAVTWKSYIRFGGLNLRESIPGQRAGSLGHMDEASQKPVG
jgi:MFS transporter, AAHS family, 4-hydroxybenzoate transporter